MADARDTNKPLVRIGLLISAVICMLLDVCVACSGARTGLDMGAETVVDASATPDASVGQLGACTLVLCGVPRPELCATARVEVREAAIDVAYCDTQLVGADAGWAYWVTCCMGSCGEYRCGSLAAR